MTFREKVAQALKKKLAAMGITSDAELQKALQHDGEKIA